MDEATLTERDRFWLEHLGACEAQSMRLSEYARQMSLSVQAMYNAKSRLRRLGKLSASTGAAIKPRFARVVVKPDAGEMTWPQSGCACRVQLANGASVELSMSPEALGPLLRTLASLP